MVAETMAVVMTAVMMTVMVMVMVQALWWMMCLGEGGACTARERVRAVMEGEQGPRIEVQRTIKYHMVGTERGVGGPR